MDNHLQNRSTEMTDFINRTHDSALPKHVVNRLAELEESVEELLDFASLGSLARRGTIFTAISRRLMDLHVQVNHQQHSPSEVTANTKITEVVNDDGRTFTVRIIHEGDRYGRDDCLTHDESEPMVEFFDKTYIEGFTPLGQFVSRYYLSTLEGPRAPKRELREIADPVGPSGWLGQASQARGLKLHDIEVWYVTAQNVADAIAFAHTLDREGA